MKDATMESLFKLLAEYGGTIESTGKMDEMNIKQARASGRMYVDQYGLGYVWMPGGFSNGPFPETVEEVNLFEKWFPLEVPLPEGLENLKLTPSPPATQGGGRHDPDCYSRKPSNTLAPNPCTCKLKLPVAHEVEENIDTDPICGTDLFKKLKWEIEQIQSQWLSMRTPNMTAIESNPATHRIAKYVYTTLTSQPCEPGVGWVSVEDRLPELIKGKDYSKNVLVINEGNIGVMAYCYIHDAGGYAWCNCYGRVDADNAEFDDDYYPTHWRPLPAPPNFSNQPNQSKTGNV